MVPDGLKFIGELGSTGMVIIGCAGLAIAGVFFYDHLRKKDKEDRAVDAAIDAVSSPLMKTNLSMVWGGLFALIGVSLIVVGLGI